MKIKPEKQNKQKNYFETKILCKVPLQECIEGEYAI